MAERELNVKVNLQLEGAERQWQKFTKQVEGDLQTLQARVRVGGDVQGGGTLGGAGGGGAQRAMASRGASAAADAGRAAAVPQGSGIGVGGAAGLAGMARGAMGAIGIAGGVALAGGAAAVQAANIAAPGALSGLYDSLTSAVGNAVRGAVGGDSALRRFGADQMALGRASGQVGAMLQNAPEVGQEQIESFLRAYQRIYTPGARNQQTLQDASAAISQENGEQLLGEAVSVLKDILGALTGG